MCGEKRGEPPFPSNRKFMPTPAGLPPPPPPTPALAFLPTRLLEKGGCGGEGNVGSGLNIAIILKRGKKGMGVYVIALVLLADCERCSFFNVINGSWLEAKTICYCSWKGGVICPNYLSAGERGEKLTHFSFFSRMGEPPRPIFHIV